MLENMSVLGKWSLLIALSLSIYGIVFLSEEEELQDQYKIKVYG